MKEKLNFKKMKYETSILDKVERWFVIRVNIEIINCQANAWKESPLISFIGHLNIVFLGVISNITFSVPFAGIQGKYLGKYVNLSGFSFHPRFTICYKRKCSNNWPTFYPNKKIYSSWNRIYFKFYYLRVYFL